MHWGNLPINVLAPWARLNNVEFNGAKVAPLPGSKGSGVIATADSSEGDAPLMSIPQELVLSLDNVWIYAKSDRHLLQVLEAVGDYSRVSRPHQSS